jgi:apolipoprotein N-acyltransferase
LKISSINPVAAGRYGLAALAGLLLSAAFAPAGLAGAGWAAPGLILFCGLGGGAARTFRAGFVAGLAHFLSSLYWLLAMPFAWHGIPLAPALGWIALSAYGAFYFAAWVWFCWRVFPGPSASREFSLVQSVDEFVAVPLWKRIGWAIVCAAGWTALEVARGRLLSGFPWNFLGVSQYRLLPVIQIASITGVYGVSFLMVWFSVAVGAAMLILVRQPAGQRVWGDAALPLLAVCGVVAYGMTQFGSGPAPTRQLAVALIQPSIPQTLIFDPREDAARFNEVIALSEKALASKPDLLIWPESAVPDLEAENRQTIARLLAAHPVWLMFCADSAEPSPSGGTACFNSAYLVSPQGAVEGIYHKRRLVIFGEYIPLVRWLPFLKWLTPIGSGFTPGNRPVTFHLSHPAAVISVLICFEDMFPQEAREHVGPDTDFLVNLTNDGWFGEGAEQWQQAASAVFRAVENGVPLVRCTNNGLTCWIDAQGRIREMEDAGGSIYGAGYIAPKIPLRAPGQQGRTFYNRFGDWFGWCCCGLGGLALLAGGKKGPPRHPMSSDSQGSVQN